MGRIRKIGVALVLSGVMAVGFGTSLSAASKKPGGGGGNGKDAICSYLTQIIDYEYTTPTVLVYVLSLYRLHGCGAE